MPEKPITPPWRKAIQELNSPNHRQGFYTELVNREDSAYQAVWPIKRGTPYAAIAGADSRVIALYTANPLYFLKQLRPGNSSSSDFGATDQAVIWIWATDELAENTYNADVDYPGESTSVPRYVRTSHVRRKDYDANPAAAYLSTFTGLLSVAITNAGTGYTQASATIATGATAEAVCFGGQIIDWIVTREGMGVTSGGALTITGDGTGASATARIQPATSVLVHQEKKELPLDDPRSHDYVQVIRVYETIPGVEISGAELGTDIRGRNVTTSQQIVAAGTSPDSGSLVLDSTVTPIDAVKSLKKTTSVASLPPDEDWQYWDVISLPLLLFDITNNIFCDGSPFFTLVSNPSTAGGTSQIRRHRITISYHTSEPTLDATGLLYEKTDIRYQGKVINFSYGDVLNDAISYDQDFITSSEMSACGWTEAYDFAETDVSATEFAAGLWLLRQWKVEPWGQSGYKATKIEFYSAPGDPPP